MLISADVITQRARERALDLLWDLPPSERTVYRSTGSDSPVDTLIDLFACRDANLTFAPLPPNTAPSSPPSLGWILAHTSGSTGSPKPTIITEAHITPLVNFLTTHASLPLVGLICSPLYASGPLAFAAATILAGGALRPTVNLPEDLNGASYALLTPSQVRKIRSEHSDLTPANTLVILGGEPVSDELLNWSREHLATRVATMYGTSEHGTISILLPEQPVGSSGRPIVPIYLESDGQIHACAPGSDMFTPTGDYGHMVSNGYLSVDGRADNAFFVGGTNVYPSEIESVLLEYPGISQALVYPIPHQTLGNVPQAEVVAVPFDQGALLDYLSSRLPSPKVPRTVTQVTALSLSPTGKIVRPVPPISEPGAQ